MIKKRVQILAGIISLICLLSFSASADVTVYAEGAYTDTDLVVYIYADVTEAPASPLVSYGVKLTYDTDEVDVPAPASVVKDDSVWYFGTSGAPLATPNADPVVSTPGEIVIVGGKIDETAPTEGVSGDRQLIAVVTFVRAISGSVPTTIGLELGKVDPYANFVQEDGTVLDALTAPAFDIGGVAIFERGDASEDGLLDSRDIRALRGKIGTPDLPVWNDCSADGVVDSRDIRCLRGKI